MTSQMLGQRDEELKQLRDDRARIMRFNQDLLHQIRQYENRTSHESEIVHGDCIHVLICNIDTEW
jgi:hypothetical protein